MKKRKEFIKLSPFDKEFFDYDYIKKLPEKERQWFLNFIKEDVNGMINKGKDSVYNNLEARKNKLEKIKEDAQEYEDFLKAYKMYKTKHNKRMSQVDFVKVYWQQEANRHKHHRRNDAHSRLLNRKFENINASQIPKKYQDEQFMSAFTESGEEFLSNAVEERKLPEEIQDFLDYKKIDRLDKYIWLRLIDVGEIEQKKNKHFQMMLEDMKPRNEEFENKTFPRTKYLLYLYSCLVVCETFAKEKDALKIVDEIRNIFDLIIYPRNAKMLLQKEKE